MAEKLWNGNKKVVNIRISFHGEKHCIQVGKDVIRILGTPSYITLKINSEKDSLVIESAVEKHKLSFKVPQDLYLNKKREMIITSISFVTGIMKSNGMDLSKTYRTEGIYSQKNNVVVFSLKDAKAVAISKKKKDELQTK